MTRTHVVLQLGNEMSYKAEMMITFVLCKQLLVTVCSSLLKMAKNKTQELLWSQINLLRYQKGEKLPFA